MITSPDSRQNSLLTRRDFLQRTALVASAGLLSGPATIAAEAPSQTVLPRWRGFNLTEFFQALDRGGRGHGDVVEDDLRWMREWGFDFVRLPMDYWLWIDSDWPQTRKLKPDDLFLIKESALEKVDRTVQLCQKHQLHLSLNFHRAPGYCINDPEREPLVLWKDKQAEDAFVYHWEVFAKRYRGIPTKELSFNLVNEAPRPRDGYMTREDYVRVMTRATKKIRETNPDRIILIDGLNVGMDVVTEMVPTGVAQSVHAYWPSGISHYRASWVDRKMSFPLPTWPLRNKDGTIQADRQKLEELYAPWAKLARGGIGVHCGECGCFNKTPCDVFLAWFEDVLDILKRHGLGYALWNFRGSFGVLDSGRTDIAYEDWHGRKLDRRLLTLMQKY